MTRLRISSDGVLLVKFLLRSFGFVRARDKRADAQATLASINAAIYHFMSNVIYAPDG